MDGTKPSKLEEICLDLVNKLRNELGPQPYSSVDLIIYTSNLSNKIGFGGYGDVYKGYLPDGVPIAVKVLKNNDVTDDTFLAEVRILGMASHRHVVKFYGYCLEDSMKALVFEYMENGSLDKILYENHHPSIEWGMLYGIAIEIANGLKYLHEDMDRQIIHHDIKAGNVLLDKNFSAKIIDFGLARSINRDVSRVPLSRERGTYGYNAPETWMPNSQVTWRCDVYSFGMMLFEILGKRKNGLGKNWFPGIVWNQFKSGKLQQLIKECGIKEIDKEKAISLSKVALRCIQYTPELRPSMEDVVLMLQDKKLIEDPPYPLFLHWQDSTSQVVSEECRVDNERERSDSLERGDHLYPQNIIADQTNASVADKEPGGYGGDSLPQLREEDLAITTKLVGKTALKYSKMILKWISKDEAGTFCINGMGGVGKTTILDDVYNQLIEKDLKQKIIWVSVSKDDNFIKLLQEELEIKLQSDDVLKRSRVLSQALKKRKKVVLFLDDIWKEISLDEIGIPQPTQENECKLIFTTRTLHVSRKMGCHKDNSITVEPLPEDEAWDLFMKKINCVLTPEVRKVAEMVAKKCSGLPLAIITVGKAMSDEKYSDDIKYWEGALNELSSKDPSSEIMEMEMENVYKCLKFSYDRLGNDILRQCFLCCALYPESWKILKRDLLEFWIIEGIVVGVSRQNELDKGDIILNRLKDHCLLETVDIVYDFEYGDFSDGVKMHDLVRDMALRLKNKCFMVKDGPSLKKLPNEDEWVDVEKISFMTNEIEVISISPKCPYLSTVILKGTFLKSVSHDFFVHMKCLKVLDLRCDRFSKNTDLKLLPDSISDLENLRVLRLNWYKKLKKLPSLAKLVLLRTLELGNTSIKELPEGMEMLVNLRRLNLEQVQLKERIPFGLISKLSALQELYLSSIELDKLYEVGKGESFAEELLSLKKLENLSVSFHCLSDYASYVGSPNFKGLTCFYLSIDRMSYSWDYLGPPPYATVRICYPVDKDKHTAASRKKKFFPQNTKRVEIAKFHNVIRLNELGWLIKDVKELVAFTVYCCDKMECIWSSKQNEELCDKMQSLEKIQLILCTKLYTLFEGIPISSGVFCLKELKIHNCNNLKNVFPSSRLLQLFAKLEQITVGDCGEIEELIGDDEENRNTETPIAIPSLNFLWIWDLPKLKRIYRGVMICNSLKNVSVERCLELKRLPQLKGEGHSTPPSALRKIKGSREWWDSLEWDTAYPQNILQSFFIEEDIHNRSPDLILLEGIEKGFTLKEVGVIRASKSEVGCCHFSSDGKLIASGWDNKAVLWYTDSLKPKTMLVEHSMLITDIRFSPSLPCLATSSIDKTVRVWDVDNSDYSLRTFTGHSASVMSLDFHPYKEDLICSCDSDSEIRYWSINNGSCVSVFKGGASQIRFQPRLGRLVRGLITYWQSLFKQSFFLGLINNGSCVSDFKGGATKIRFQPCLGRYLATASENVVSIFDVETQSCPYTLQGHTEAICSVCWDPSGELLASVTEDSVRIWTLGSGKGECVHELSREYGNEFHSCVFHPTNPSLLLIGSGKEGECVPDSLRYGCLTVWDMAENKIMYKVAHLGLIASLAVSNVTGLVASASHDNYVKLWEWL